MPNKRPLACYSFNFLPAPRTSLGSSLFLNFNENDLFMNFSFYFLSSFVLFKHAFQVKIARLCVYLIFMLDNSLFSFVLSLFDRCKPFLKFRSVLILTLLFTKFRNFFRLPCVLGPPFNWHLRVALGTFPRHTW